MLNYFNNIGSDKLLEFIRTLLNDALKNNSKSFIETIYKFFELSERGKIQFDQGKIPSPREEGNVITAFCFRNTLLEDLHSQEVVFNNTTMKELMKESSWKLTEWLIMKESLLRECPLVYYFIVNFYETLYTEEWDKS
jgi:hypothetical protein